MSVFNGFMKIPAKTYTKEVQPIFEGDWAKSDTRYRIFKKPRKYMVTLHLFNEQGDKAVETLEPTGLLTKDGLSDLVYEQINRMIDDYPEQEIDLLNSYLIIRV